MRKSHSLLIAVVALGFLAGGAAAQVPNPFSFYVGAGYSKLNMDNAPGGSVGLSAGGIFNLPVTGLGLGAEVGYLMLGSKDLPVGNGLTTDKWTFSAVPVTAQGYYHLPLPGVLVPWATVGFGMYNYRVKIGSSNDNTTKTGFNVGAGADLSFPASGFKFGVDLRYHVINTDVESSKLITALARMYL